MVESFLLKIFFSGLIAFVPSQDGKTLTVLLLQTDGHTVSAGTHLQHHQPVLLARAQTCKTANGKDCELDTSIATFFYGDPASRATDALALAVEGGGVLDLENTELVIRPAGTAKLPPLSLHKSIAAADRRQKLMPDNACERKDFGWVADLKQIFPSFGEFNPALFGPRPPKKVVAARLVLTGGDVFTYSLVRVDNQLQPIHFRARSSNKDAAYVQTVANWVEANIQVPARSIDIVARNFDTGTERTMTLTPLEDGKVVELAVLNLPPFKAPPAGARRPLPQPGDHFELFYNLAANPPNANQRPIPRVDVMETKQLEWNKVHPRDELKSPLLSRLQLDAGKGPYEVLLCPVSQGGQP